MGTNVAFTALARRISVSGLLGMGLVGCNFGKRNVAACNDWVETMDATFADSECGGTDFGVLLDSGCDIFEESKCDVGEYFVCLEENTECSEEGGEINTEGWSDCVSLSTCE